MRNLLLPVALVLTLLVAPTLAEPDAATTPPSWSERVTEIHCVVLKVDTGFDPVSADLLSISDHLAEYPSAVIIASPLLRLAVGADGRVQTGGHLFVGQPATEEIADRQLGLHLKYDARVQRESPGMVKLDLDATYSALVDDGSGEELVRKNGVELTAIVPAGEPLLVAGIADPGQPGREIALIVTPIVN